MELVGPRPAHSREFVLEAPSRRGMLARIFASWSTSVARRVMSHDPVGAAGQSVSGSNSTGAGAGLLLYLLMSPSKESQDPKKAAHIGPWAQGSVAGVQIRF